MKNTSQQQKRTMLKQLLSQAAQLQARKDVAIVGLSGRYPMAETLDEFWSHLKEGRNCIREIPKERWTWEEFLDKGSSYTRWGGFLHNVDKFDPWFFQMTPKEAEELDPQERLFLQTAWSVLEDAGITLKELTQTDRRVGVFVGVMNHDYANYGGTSSYWSMANRISYLFNLQGPSLAVDTACSSSLTAIHLACESIRRGECHTAIVGGVNLIVHPDHYSRLCNMNMLSKGNACSAFGADADGFVDGEGVGAVLLKPLQKAVADGDQIYAVIKGSSINAGGKTGGYTVPNPKAQAALVQTALEAAQVDPSTITYVEAHGTGTSLGDPIEIAGLSAAFQQEDADETPSKSCAIGSVKSNIGHLESAAGIAGLTKVLLQMKYGQLVPSLHADPPNPNISFENTSFYVQRQLTEWKRLTEEHQDGRIQLPRRAGISSFGAGGANAHLIVEEYMSPAVAKIMGSEAAEHGPQLIVLSAKDNERLKSYADSLYNYLNIHRTELSLADAAYTLQIGRETMESRLAVVAENVTELCEQLFAFVHNKRELKGVYTATVSANMGTVGFMDVRFVRDLHQIAAGWVSGAEIDWKLLHGELRPSRISLPTYSFAQEAYWIAEKEAPAPQRQEQLHQLLDRNISTLEEQMFTLRLTEQHFIMAEHREKNRMLMPAAAMLEMARAAGDLSGHQQVTQIYDVKWMVPVELEQAMEAKEPVFLDLYINLYRDEGGIYFEIWSSANSGNKVVHAEGQMKSEPVQKSTQVDIAALQAACPAALPAKNCYDLFAKSGLHYGPSFQAIEQLYSGKDACISKIRLPEHRMKNDAGLFVLHPSLIDGAMQSIAGLILSTEDHADAGSMQASKLPAYLPISLGKLERVRPLKETCWICVTRAEINQGAPQALQSRSFHIQIVDEAGNLLIHLRNFTVIPHLSPSEMLLTETESVHIEGEWVKQALPQAPEQQSTGTTTVLLFDQEGLLALPFKTALQYQKKSNWDVIIVKQGTEFKRTAGSEFQIRPGAKEDYVKLFKELLLLDKSPDYMLHGWSCSRNETTSELGPALENSIYSMTYLTQAHIEINGKQPFFLLYAYTYRQEETEPAYAAVTAFAKSLMLEQPAFYMKTIGIEASDAVTLARDGTLLAELLSADDQPEILYRGSHRAVKMWREGIREIQPIPALENPIRQKGVYLITGGIGGLGMLYASYLARTAQAKLVLTGRSELDAAHQEKLRELEEMGAEVIYVKADVSKPGDAAHLIKETKDHFQYLHGIIHSAGVTRDRLLHNKNSSDLEDVLAPKTYGTVMLDEYSQHEKLDFFVLFSSLAGVLGNIGQADYAYANNFMDHFAERRESKRRQGLRHGKSLSVNWPYWLHGGMQLEDEERSRLEHSLGISSLETEKGLRIFEQGLSSSGTQWIVLEGGKDKILKAFNRTRPGIKQISSLSPIVSRSLEEVSSVQQHAEAYVMEVLCKETKIPPAKVKPQDSFDKYGIDSVVMMRMLRYLEQDFGEMSKTLYFEYPTITALAAYIAESFKEQLCALYPSDDQAERVDEEKMLSAIQSPPSNKKKQEHQETCDGSAQQSQDIAIIGLSGRYPMAENLDEFWENLKDGRDCITEIPEERWDYRSYYAPGEKQAGKSRSKWGGFIQDVDKFDSLFFNISPKEAKNLDPQERLFLETVWHTLEDGGYPKAKLEHEQVGVFVGVMYGQYQLFGAEEMANGNPVAPISSYASIANRVSYYFNFHGPSMAVDSMCSSSLTAIHLAVQSLQKGESKLAVAGGVNVTIHPAKYVQLSDANFASSDGRCRSFGEGGDGYVPGEGVGAVLLKPLQQAVADGDHIYGVIRASVLNHGGRKNGYTVPNPNAQGELISKALQEANLTPQDISYIEAHGTGTSLGDPIEITGLTQAFGRRSPEEGPCPIGSVKSNIGHLEAAAGIAALTKVLLQMKYKQLVPSIHAAPPNPHLNMDPHTFTIQRSLADWEQPVAHVNGAEKRKPRVAGISSFGAGGSNAHLIIEEFAAREEEPRRNTSTIPQLLPLSARNEERLREYAAQIIEFLEARSAAPVQSDGQVIRAVQKRLAELLADVLEVEKDQLAADDHLLDLGLDRVKLSSFIQRVSLTYSIQVRPEICYEVSTLAGLASHLYLLHGDALHLIHGSDVLFADAAMHLEDIAYTLQTSREQMETRLAVIADSAAEFKENLLAYVQGDTEDSSRLFIGNALVGKASMPEGQDVTEWANAWVQGVNLPEEVRFVSEGAKKQSLPMYPFKRERHWIVNSVSQQHAVSGPGKPMLGKLGYGAESRGAKIHHPLIDRIDLAASMEAAGIVYRKTIRRSDWIVRDHQVQEKLILPGVAHIEMALAAVSEVKPLEAFTLNKIHWLQPVVVDEEEVELELLLRSEENRLIYEVRSSKSGSIVTHSRGEWIAQSEQIAREEQNVNVEQIRANCTSFFEQTELYRRFQQLGLTYGECFQGVQRIWGNEQEAIGELEIPRSLAEASRYGEYTLHPTLMDAALQSIAGIQVEQDAELMLPFSVEKIEILHPLSAKGYAHITLAGKDRYHIAILNESGRICLCMNEVSVRRMSRWKMSSINHHSNFYYVPRWVSAPLPQQSEYTWPSGKVLIISPLESCGIEQQLIAGHCSDQVEILRLIAGKQASWGKASEAEHIYFLGGILNPDHYSTQIAAKSGRNGLNSELYEQVMEQGVMSLFRLVKALEAQGKGDQQLQLTIMTNNVHALTETEQTLPYAAAIHGFSKSLMKEYPNWTIRYIDIDLNDTERSVEALYGNQSQSASVGTLVRQAMEGIVSEITQSASASYKQQEEIIWRSGKRYMRSMYPVYLPVGQQTVFSYRKNGVYLIVGGAGGIGMELARNLMHKVQARIILIGRSPLDARRKQQLEELEAAGGEVLYLQGNAGQADSIRAAIQAAKAHFGSIHGVFHSAIVLQDGAVRNMSEDSLYEVLQPKVQGSIHLCQALADEPLDFMMFFSSAQSFTGNAGQSNYAAACTFKDAFAKYIGNHVSYPVKVINWGYWGGVGVVASEQYQRRLASQGIYSIETKEGMEAVERLLHNPIDQVMAMKADKRLLEKIGVDFSHQIRLNHGTAGLSFNSMNVIDKSLSTQPLLTEEQKRMTAQAFDQLERLGRLLLLDSFQSMGVFVRSNENYQRLELQEELGLLPAYSRWLDTALVLLEQGGFLRVSGMQVGTTEKVESEEVLLDFEALREGRDPFTLGSLIREHVKLLKACFLHYPDILRGNIPATDVLFPQSSMALVEGIYRNNETADYFNDLVLWSVRLFIEQRIMHIKPGEELRILEIGAGTGGTSDGVLRGIAEFGDRISYTYTDVSPSFTKYGKQQFGADYPFVQFQILNIEKDIEPQGFHAGDYDLIIATNVLHATQNMQQTLRRIKQMLKITGWIVLNEATVVDVFANLTFGLLEGWWRYHDPEERMRNSPLLSTKMWEQLLRRTGFTETRVLGPTGNERSGLLQNIMIGESDGWAMLIDQQEQGHDQMEKLVSEDAAEGPFQAEPKAMQPSAKGSIASDEAGSIRSSSFEKPVQQTLDLLDDIEETILDATADALEINKADIHPERSFAEYGVDSITGVELIKKLNETFGIILKTTALFDYGNIKDLSRFIAETYLEVLPQKESARKAPNVPYELNPLSENGIADKSSAAADSRQMSEYVADVLLDVISETLEVNKGAIQLERSFAEYGVDSITGLELVQRINSRLGLSLKTIILFDYGNVKELADWIVSEYSGSIASASMSRAERADEYGGDIDLLERLVNQELDLDEVYQLMGWEHGGDN